MKSKSLLPFGVALCSLFTPVNPAFAQGTAFTYPPTGNHYYRLFKP